MIDVDAVLWDLDGTIADTEPLWIAAERRLADEHGGIWTEEDSLHLVGSALIDAGEYIRTTLGLALTAAEVVDRLVERVVAGVREHVEWRPGAVELLKAFEAEEVPQALVTMSWAVIADEIAPALPFDAVVTGDVVTRGKPHPEPYLMAAERLDVDPSRCLAIEDSATGAASANAAGCHVVVVPHVVKVPEADRRVAIPTLAGLVPDDLRALF